MTKFLCPLALLLTAAACHGGEPSPPDAMLAAYADMQYPQACKLAARHPELPEARLVKALCAVFDRRKQDLDAGMPELQRLYADPSLKPALRAEAGLAYARAAQTLRMRPGVYPPADNIDFNELYDELIAQHPASAAAVFAAVYQAQGYFDSKDPRGAEKGFARLNDLLARYPGPKSQLSPVHYLLADQYIVNGARYDQAVKELETARELGFANPRNRETVAFRIARIYDFHLRDRAAATLNYQRFLEEFPNSASAPVAKRHLKALDNGKKEAGNGKAE